MSDKQVTAVQWLFDRYFENDIITGDDLEKAIAIEREQIKEAHIKGGHKLKWSHDEFQDAADQYYTETYGE